MPLPLILIGIELGENEKEGNKWERLGKMIFSSTNGKERLYWENGEKKVSKKRVKTKGRNEKKKRMIGK